MSISKTEKSLIMIGGSLLLIPIILLIAGIAILTGGYLTVIISAWFWGQHVSWSIFDIINLPFEEVILICISNFWLFVIVTIIMFAAMLNKGRSSNTK
ncbi:MAG: hypothetical protein ACW98D_19230 [Promethearchaeota archaeon]|jgi:hypothetical protein